MIRIALLSTPEPARRHRAGHGLRRTRGFSLIELMVSMVLGLLVVAGLINLFVANRKAYQIQSGNNYLQENLRIASDRVGWSLRMADFWGGNKPAAIAVTAGGSVTAKGDCDGTWATAISSGTGGGAVFGYDGAATFPLDAACIGGEANYLKGSDVLVLRYAEPEVLSPGPAASSEAPAVAATITGHAKQIFLLSIPGATGELFSGGIVPATGGNNSLRRYVHPYQIDMYYLSPCSVPVGSTCTSAADGGMPVPTLMRMHLQSGGAFISEPVVDGIEQLKFEYGVANAATGVPEYASADAVSGDSWANVVAVRVSVIAVNAVRDISVPHTGTYTLGTLGECSYIINRDSAPTTTDCADFTPFGGDKPWQFVRASQQFVVQLRNRVRG